jgi:hypothetical protein
MKLPVLHHSLQALHEVLDQFSDDDLVISSLDYSNSLVSRDSLSMLSSRRCSFLNLVSKIPYILKNEKENSHCRKSSSITLSSFKEIPAKKQKIRMIEMIIRQCQNFINILAKGLLCD